MICFSINCTPLTHHLPSYDHSSSLCCPSLSITGPQLWHSDIRLLLPSHHCILRSISAGGPWPSPLSVFVKNSSKHDYTCAHTYMLCVMTYFSCITSILDTDRHHPDFKHIRYLLHSCVRDVELPLIWSPKPATACLHPACSVLGNDT